MGERTKRVRGNALLPPSLHRRAGIERKKVPRRFTRASHGTDGRTDRTKEGSHLANSISRSVGITKNQGKSGPLCFIPPESRLRIHMTTKSPLKWITEN